MNTKIASLLPADFPVYRPVSLGSGFVDYDGVAVSYDEYRTVPSKSLYLKLLTENLSDRDSLRMASFCCGPGKLEYALVSHLNRSSVLVDLHLFDASAEMLKLANQRIGTVGIEPHCHHVNLVDEDLKFAENYFDLVVCSQACQHWDICGTAERETIRRVLSKMCRLLKPGGIVLFDFTSQLQQQNSTWFMNVLRGHVPLSEDPGIRYSYRFPTLEQILSDSIRTGFGEIRSKKFPGPFFHQRVYSDPEYWTAQSEQEGCNVRLSNSFFNELRRYPEQERLYNLVLDREIRNGRILDRMEQAELARKELGQGYFISARKRY